MTTVKKPDQISAIDMRPRFDPENPLNLGIGMTSVSFGPYDQSLLEKMLPVRADFVEAMGWSTSESKGIFDFAPTPATNWMEGYDYRDADIYDTLESTIHLLVAKPETGEVIAGLRLTRLSSLEESMSWSMVRGNPEIRDAVYAYRHNNGTRAIEDIQHSAETGNLWDLTRLVVPVNGSVSSKEMAAGIMELFATGFGICKKQVDSTRGGSAEDIRWINSATDIITACCNNLQIQFDILGSGRVSDKDDCDTYFCVSNLSAAVRHIEANAAVPRFVFPYEHMRNGLQKADAL